MSRITRDICEAMESADGDRFRPSLAFLRRHPMPIRAYFDHCLVLTYAFPGELLEPLLPPGLTLDTYGNMGFLAIAMVQARDLRSAFLPKFTGADLFMTGYRIFARYKTKSGRNLRGLRILRSDTNRKWMAVFGNFLTHYNYQVADTEVSVNDNRLEIQIKTPSAKADLHVIADLKTSCAEPPPGSPFDNLRQARLFAGPLPFTFDYEKETNSIVLIEGVRANWRPCAVKVEVLKAGFLEQPPFNQVIPVLANAFYITGVPYEWKRGRRETLN